MAKVLFGPAVADLRRSAGNMRFSKCRGGNVAASKHLEAAAAAATDGARVYNTEATIIPDSAETTITFNTERYNVGNLFDPTTEPTRLTAQKAGVYAITLNALVDTQTPGYVAFWIRLNGTTHIAIQADDTGTDLELAVSITTLWRLAVADYLEATILQYTGLDASLFFFRSHHIEIGCRVICFRAKSGSRKACRPRVRPRAVGGRMHSR